MAVRTGNDWATWSYQDLIDTLGTGLGTVYAAVYGKLPGQTEPVQTFSASPEIRTEAPVGQMPSNAYQQVEEAMAPNIAAVKEYMKTEDYRLQNMSVADAKENIRQEIANQQKSLAGQGVNWNSGIPVDDTIDYMAGQLAKAGVKTIYDLEVRKVPGPDQVIGGGGESGEQIYGPGPEQNALINKRTGQAIPPEYAFAQMGDTGGTWGGTFAGEGSTRFNVNFVDGVPVFTAQQQATVKSGLEKLAGVAVPIGLGIALGPAGLGLSSAAAGAIAGGAGGLLKSGDIEDALKGAALGAAGGFAKEALLGGEALAGDPTRAALYSNAGYGEGLLNMVPPPVISEPVLVPGDTALTGTLAQPPLAVENIAGQLTPEATAMLGPSAGAVAAGDLAAIEASMGTPAVDATGSATKAALLGDAGYGPGLIQGEAPIIESTPTSMGPGKEVSGLQVAKDIVTSLPGASQQYLTTALTTLGLDPDLVNNIVGWKPSGASSTTTQTGGGGSNFLGPIIGGLLSRQQQGAPTPGIIQGKGVDITSPIQSLLAPKLVQQRPVTLL
jgi:hypothetical protein